MKKIFFFTVLAAAFTFAACGNEEATEEQPQEDSVVVEEAPVADTMVVEEPVAEEPVEAVKPATKKAAAAQKEEPKKIDVDQLKKAEKTIPGKEMEMKNAAADAKATRSDARFQGKQPADNGNTLKKADESKAVNNNDLGTKKKGLTVK